MARPQKLTDKEIKDKVNEYLENCEAARAAATTPQELMVGIPQVRKFAKTIGLSKTTIYRRAEQDEALRDSIKEIIEEKENVLEEYALTGVFNNSMAIFSLKQVGWKDKIETEADVKQTVTIEMSEELSDYAD